MRRLLLLTFLIAATAIAANAQQPTSFTYQGKLNVSSLPANGVYDFFFTVSDVPTGTGSVDSTIFISGVQVTNGIFTVNLDFPSTVWTSNPGPRFLTIAVRGGSNPTYFVLEPRQSLTSTPFATNALSATTALNATNAVNANNATTATSAQNADNAAALGGLSAANYLRINPPTTQPGGFAVQSGLVSGNLTAATLNAATQFNLGGERFLSAPGAGNLFAGRLAGNLTMTGSSNTGIGEQALLSVSAGTQNTAVGAGAGFSLANGSRNVFVGVSTGSSTGSGGENTFVGYQAGQANNGGAENVIVGSFAGSGLVSESKNTLVGFGANVATPGVPNASAFGALAFVTAPNSLVLGSINGVNGATADTNVGIGTTAPLSRLDVRGNLFVGLSAQPNVPASFLTDARAVYVANDAGDANNSFRIDGAENNLYFVARSANGSNAGAGLVFSTAPTGLGEIERMSITPTGQVRVNVLGTSGATPLCRNSNNEIATCGGALADDTKRNDEQDALIRQQKEQIERQQKEIDALKALICGTNSTAEVCRQPKPKE